MKTIILFLEGVSVNKPFKFCNGFVLSKLKELTDLFALSKIQGIISDDDLCILYKSVDDDNYNKELFDLGVFTTEMISLELNKTDLGVEVLAASSYHTYNIPNVLRYWRSQSLARNDLKSIDNNLKNFEKRSLIEKEKIETAIMYLNKSKICLNNVNGNYEHAIFLRVALENCFDAPRKSIESAVAQKATILLNQFDPLEVKRMFKRFYSQLSGATHSGKVPKKPKDNAKERKVKIAGQYMSDILAISINKIIESGFPDWEMEGKISENFLARLKSVLCTQLQKLICK
jgi:hypothetical protein